jgi:hypothetical protein
MPGVFFLGALLLFAELSFAAAPLAVPVKGLRGAASQVRDQPRDAPDTARLGREDSAL